MSTPGEADVLPQLDERQLDLLEAVGECRQTLVGERLYRAGDATYHLFVILSGAVEVVLDDGNAEERVIAQLGPGMFLGELNMLTGQRVYLSARVTAAGEVVRVPADVARRLIAIDATLGDTIVTAFLARRDALRSGAGSSIRLLGSRYVPETRAVREYLARHRIPHEWVEPDADGSVDEIGLSGVSRSELPAVLAPGAVLLRATPASVASHLGMTLDGVPDRFFDLVVVGAGPAGLAAAVYGASEGLRTLTLDSLAPGGQAGSSSRIENYLGFPTGISGAELVERAVVQAERFGAQLTSPCVVESLREESGHLVVRLADGTDIAGRAVIAASGARYRRLPLDRLQEFEGNGVYYAANQAEARACGLGPVVVVGGGNSAGQAAMFLADCGNEVTLVARRADLADTMSQYLIDRIAHHARAEVCPRSTVTDLVGNTSLEGIIMQSNPAGSRHIPCVGLFSFIGAEPSSAWLSELAALDSGGFVLTDRSLSEDSLDERWSAVDRPPLPYETSQPGLFAVGDVRAGSTKRVAAAVGEGSAAVRSVHQHLSFV